jgi:hypothetical protein
MKNKKIIIALLVVATSAGAFFIGCKKEDSASDDTTTYNIRMTDAPGDYQEVNVNIIGVEVHSDQKGWIALNVKTGVYNLLKFSNGIDTLIGSGQIPVGTVSQIRLILGSDKNTVKVNNQVYPLSTPSAEQSGLKLQVHSELVKNVTYNLSLDFDANKSIVVTGNNTYKLKPVIRVITTATSGGISGTASPLVAQPAIYAIMGTDTFGTNASSVTGEFLIQGLASGSYKVILMPKSPFRDTTFSNIMVNVGGITSMGTIVLQ